MMAVSCLECDIEEFVYSNQLTSIEKGFPELRRVSKRQVRLPNNLRIDLLSWDIVDDNLFLTIVEFKKGEVGVSAMCQAARYHLEVVLECYGLFTSITTKVIVCGETIADDAYNLALLGSNVDLVAYEIGLGGISFQVQNKGQEFLAVKEPKQERFERSFADFLIKTVDQNKELNQLKKIK